MNRTANKWLFVSRPFTANGTASGLVQVSDTIGFFVGQVVRIASTTAQPIIGKVNRVINKTSLVVVSQSDDQPLNLSAYTVADNATITAYEQSIPRIKIDEILPNVYEHEPATAIRTLPVDYSGEPYTPNNPLPTADWTNHQMAPAEYDAVQIVRDTDGRPLQYRFYLNSVLMRTINVTYNIDRLPIYYQRI